MKNKIGTLTVAKHAGFCFGVKRATSAAENLISENKVGVKTLGRLIHNDSYISFLEKNGINEISEADIDELYNKAKTGEQVIILIRAHGENSALLNRLKAFSKEYPNFKIVDCTCPYVNKVRQIAQENSGEDRLFILIGAAEHPEVKGIMSCVKGDGFVFSSANELEKWLFSSESQNFKDKKLAIAAQTTQNLSEWKKSLKIIEKVYTNPLIFDTICRVTEERQLEAIRLAEKSDVMLVIGSHNSSNTQKLFEITSAICPETYLIDASDKIPLIKNAQQKNISITAGASTPFSVIQEVRNIMNEQMGNFEELLDASMKTLNTGDIVTGIVTSISQNEIHLDLGAKTTGVINREQITDDQSAKLSELFKIGDEIEAFVIKVSDIDGIATLSKKRVDSDKNWTKIKAAYESGEVLEGKVVEAVKGGVIIIVDAVRVFIPGSHTGIAKDGDLTVLVGTTQKIKIIEIKNERKRAYGSIRAVIRDAKRAAEAKFWDEIEEGKVYEGPVKSLTSYGAFVDLGGVDGMVHITELSWKRLRHPSEVVSVGDILKVYVKSFDREKKRVSLGHKTDETNPWTIFKNKYSEGDVADVKIVSLMPFGAFAEIVPGVDGLIHISQIADHKIGKPEEILEIGQIVAAKIIEIDEENHKISLSMRALLVEEDKASIPEAEDQIISEAAEENDGPVMYSTDNPSAYADFEINE